jgi:hypothetical protein
MIGQGCASISSPALLHAKAWAEAYELIDLPQDPDSASLWNLTVYPDPRTRGLTGNGFFLLVAVCSGSVETFRGAERH